MKNKIVDDYIFQEELGKGEFSSVHLIKSRISNEIFAAKVIQTEIFQTQPKLQDQISIEIQVMKQLASIPQIITLYKYIKTKNNYYLIYEYCEGGSLFDLMKTKKIFNEIETKEILLQLIIGIKEMHIRKIIHRDLKPENILFKNKRIKIADFGFCKILDKNQNSDSEFLIGSPIYMAPELFENQEASEKTDIYALGVIVYEMLFGKWIFEEKNIDGLIDKIKNNFVLVFDRNINNISLEMEIFLRNTLEKKPEKRFNILEIEDYFKSGNKTGSLKLFEGLKMVKNESFSEKEIVRIDDFITKKEKFLKKLYLERLKMIILGKYLQKVIQFNLFQDNVLTIFALLKKICYLFTRMKNSLDKYLENYYVSLVGNKENQEFFKMFIQTKEFKILNEILIDEEKLSNETLSKYTSILEEDSYFFNYFPGLKQEIQKKNFDSNFYKNTLLEYAKNTEMISVEKKILVHAFIGVEIANLESFFIVYGDKCEINLESLFETMNEKDLRKFIIEKTKVLIN